MNRLSKLMKELEYKDLLLLKKDLDTGNIEKLLHRHIKDKKDQQETMCPVCGGRIKEGEGFHLQFGPPDLRKKATFDGVDCLKYFFNRNKETTEEELVIMHG